MNLSRAALIILAGLAAGMVIAMVIVFLAIPESSMSQMSESMQKSMYGMLRMSALAYGGVIGAILGTLIAIADGIVLAFGRRD